MNLTKTCSTSDRTRGNGPNKQIEIEYPTNIGYTHTSTQLLFSHAWNTICERVYVCAVWLMRTYHVQSMLACLKRLHRCFNCFSLLCTVNEKGRYYAIVNWTPARSIKSRVFENSKRIQLEVHTWYIDSVFGFFLCLHRKSI